MTDLMHRLSAARPGHDELGEMWSEQARSELLEQIEARSIGRPRGHRRRTVGLTLVAAAATTGVVAVVGTVDAPNAAATDMRALALTAAAHEGPVLGQGTWLHEQSTDVQRDSPASGHGAAVYDHQRETWTRWDGRVLLIERSPLGGWTTYDVVDGDNQISDVDAPAFHDRASYQDPTPRFASTLPDDATGLLAYLDGRVFGSSSHQEALYEALSSLATSHTLPPRTLAATFDALARVDGVRTDHVTVQGRPAIRVSFRDDVSSSTHTMTVDKVTGQLLSTCEHSKGSNYTSTTTRSEVVSTVPADILDAFKSHQEGLRYDASGAAMPS